MKLTTAFAAAVMSAAAFFPASLSAKSIVDVAAEAGVFNTLLAAATAAGFADELDEVNGLTVLAPTDDAFAALPPGTVDELLKPENRDTLRAIIAYHIFPNRIKTTDIPDKPVLVETLNGCERVRAERIVRRTSKIFMDGVRVIGPNVKASNGIIHVIGEVLIPDRACP